MREELKKDADRGSETAEVADEELAAAIVWQPMTNTQWLDGRDVVLFADGMEVHACYCKGEWTHTHEYSEYDGPMWSCFDDAFQIEIEECDKDPAVWCHGQATHWRMPAPPSGIEIGRK